MKGKILGFVTIFSGLVMGFLFIKHPTTSPGVMEMGLITAAAAIFAGIFITFVMTPDEREKIFG